MVLLFASGDIAASQTSSSPGAPSMQTLAVSTPQRTRWTEADRQALLGKARNGDARAQFWFGTAYEQEWFGRVNLQEALRWFKKAAAHGDPDAQAALGQMYQEGEGLPQNYSLAAKWYRKAAEHVPDLGAAGQGRNNLGLLYLDGLGVPKDYVRAYMWFSLVEDNTNLSDVKDEMTPAQVQKAERLVAEWKRHHPEPSGSVTSD
jgi:TPR repeat protein